MLNSAIVAVTGYQFQSHDKDLALSVLAKLRHWWPLDARVNTNYFRDVHGGMDMREYTGGTNTLTSTIRSGGSAALSIGANAGTYTNGKPGWTQSYTFSLLQWVKTTSATSDNGAFTDAPSSDTSASINTNLCMTLKGSSSPQTLNAVWEHGTGVDDIYPDSVARIGTGENHLIGISVDTANSLVRHYTDNTAFSPIAYTNAPTGGNSAVCKLSIGNIPTTAAGDTTATNANFKGSIQDVMLFDSPLTQSELSFLYNGGAGRSYTEVIDIAEIAYDWTPAQIGMKTVWIKSDHKSNIEDSGYVSQLENLAGFMPGIPYGGSSSCRFRNDLTTLNGRKILTGALSTAYLGHFYFPNTNLNRYRSVTGCSIFAVSRPSSVYTTTTVQVSCTVPGASSQLIGLQHNYNGVAGRVNAGGRRVSGDSFTQGPIAGTFPSWVIISTWNNYSSGTQNIRANGGATTTSSVFSTGATANSNPGSTIGLGGNSYNTANRSGIEFAEVICTDSTVADDDIKRIEGYFAHEWGLQSIIAAYHPYKYTRPFGGVAGFVNFKLVDGDSNFTINGATGRMTYYDSGQNKDICAWYRGSTSNPGTLYQVRFTHLAGSTASLFSGSYGVWADIGTGNKGFTWTSGNEGRCLVELKDKASDKIVSQCVVWHGDSYAP